MKVLGVHIGHDSAAALVDDGSVIADVAEERFNRRKHSHALPFASIRYCLSAAGLSADAVDVIAVSSKKHPPGFDFLCGFQPAETARFAAAGIRPPVYVEPFRLSTSVETVRVQHHLAHAASAYYTCGSSSRQLIVTLDGSGDGVSVGVWRGERGRITPLMLLPRNASLGYFYSLVTEALGWWHGDGEGKTMGLAPYGHSDRVRGVLDRFCPQYSAGTCVEPHDFGGVHYWIESGSREFHKVEAAEVRELVRRYGAADVAAEAQRVLEEQTLRLVLPWLDKEDTCRLCCAGGVFLNVKLNQRVWESGRLETQHVFPAAGDSGLAVGAALHAYHNMVGIEVPGTIETVYLGPEYSDEQIERLLKERSLPVKKLEDAAGHAARAMSDNRVVGWFQGRMESGPRALGNRSILMSPLKAGNKAVLNERVKFREPFRPYCPSIPHERSHTYLKNPRAEEFMLTTFNVCDGKAERIPAVVHADGTLRPQTLHQARNPKFWRLIDEFGARTGEYAVLNTSLNRMGEPMVEHPSQAIRCFYDSGIENLYLGNFLLTK